jgi:hypothetical protein
MHSDIVANFRLALMGHASDQHFHTSFSLYSMVVENKISFWKGVDQLALLGDKAWLCITAFSHRLALHIKHDQNQYKQFQC